MELPTARSIALMRNCYILLNQGRNAVVSLQIQTTRVAPDIVVVHLHGRMTTRVDNRVVERLPHGSRSLRGIHYLIKHSE
jgi:hypothetical protein